MNPVQETVLLYYPKKPKYSPLPKIKSIDITFSSVSQFYSG